MGYRVFHRFFTNNYKYEEINAPYVESIAFTVQEFLYTEGKACQEIRYGDTGGGYPYVVHFSCDMDGRIQLYDFMNILLHFISVIESDFAKADIKEYIADIRQGEGFYSSDTVEYTEDNGLYLKNASLEVIIALLWAVWVYIKVYVYLHPNNAMANSIKLIFNIMRENYPYSEGELKKHPLIAHASVAMTLMCQHIQAKAKKSKPSKSMAEKPVKDNTEKLLTRIKELEEEVEKLRKDIEDYQTQGKGVSASKHALLLTTLCHHLGGLPQNGRQSLSPILQKLYGYTETTATRALNQKITQKDADALAKSFSELSPRVGNAIKEMPGILEKLNNERLRKLNEQKK